MATTDVKSTEPADTSPKAVADPDFISIGIDFGTAFSGVGWALSTSPDDIHIVAKWEGEMYSGVRFMDKVPSVLRYHKNADVTSWGSMVGVLGSVIDDDKHVMISCFKLLLSEQATDILAKTQPDRYKTLQTQLKKLKKEPSDVVRDYLRLIWDQVEKDIVQCIGLPLWESLPREIVLTVPIGWDHKAQSLLRRLVQQAGVLDTTHSLQNSVHLVGDSQAAAAAVGDIFIVCDAGAAEVNLSSYQIANLKPLQLTQCSASTGGLCGSMFIEIALEKEMRHKISNERYDKLTVGSRTRMMNDLRRIIRSFRSNEEPKTWHIDVPELDQISRPLSHISNISDDPEEHFGTYKLRTDTIEAIFNDVCSQIIHLVDKQRHATLLNTGKKTNSLFLVGGFGENINLRDKLLQSFGNSDIRIYCPSYSWTASCRGAVLEGLQRDIFINHTSHGGFEAGDAEESKSSVESSYAPSIFSVASMDSSWSHLSEEEFQSAAIELISLLLNDEYLKPLYSTALRNPKIGGQRFETNFRRLLKQFAVDLKKEADDPLQVQAAKFVGSQAALVASNIRDVVQANEDVNVVPSLDGQALALQDDKDLYSSTLPSSIIPNSTEQQNMLDLSIRQWINKTDPSDLEVLEAPDDPDTDTVGLGSLADVKQFITSSDAFVAFRLKFANFVHPPVELSSSTNIEPQPSPKGKEKENTPDQSENEEKPKEVATNLPDLPSHLRYNGTMLTLTPWNLVQPTGLIDQMKAMMERSINCLIIWWPFKARKSNCSIDHVRVSWNCTCGSLLYFDTPTYLARKLVSHCIPIDATTPSSLLPVHHSPSHSASADLNRRHASVHYVDPNFPPGTETSQKITADRIGTITKLSSQADMIPNQNSTYLHWCVDSNSSDTLLFSLRLPRIDDTDIIKRLKHCYNSVKGARRWISLTECEDVKFVLFKRGAQHKTEDLIVCLKEDLPPKTDPNYSYLDTEPPDLLKDFAAQTLRHHLLNPHKCSSKEIEEIMLLVPKKVNGLLERKFGIVGWGVLAIPGLAIWKCLIALALSQIPPVIFAIRWLLGHPGDLQNAFLFSFYILGALNVILVVPENWSLRKKRF